MNGEFTMNFGFCIPTFAGANDCHPRTPMLERVEVGALVNSVREVEALGYDSVWVADHLMLGADDAILECWTLLSALARVTSRVRLGTIHLANFLREPALLAKMAATVDAISGGRLDLFFEAGHGGSRPESEAYGFGWDNDEDRLEKFEEAVSILKLMWTEDRATFHGDHYRIDDAICFPKPVQKPSIPLWIGTIGIGTIGGEALSENIGMDDQMMDIIARHADWWNNTPASAETVRSKLDTLRAACQSAGTDYEKIGKSLETQILIAEDAAGVRRLQNEIERLNPQKTFYHDWDDLRGRYVIGTPDEVTARLDEYRALGIECFMLWFMDYPSLDGVRTFADKVIPNFRQV